MLSVEQLPEAEKWRPRLARWRQRLRTARLEAVAGVLLDIVEPLGPFGAQLLWVAQPALSLLIPRDDVASLARLLDAPGGAAWLCEQLAAGNDTPQDEAPGRD